MSLDKIKRGYEKLHGTERTSTNAVTLTAKTVWIDNNPDSGLLSKSSFVPFIKALRIDDYEHTDKLIVCLKNNLRFSNPLKFRKDRGGNSYSWASFNKPNGTEGAKIMANTELVNLVQHYIDGKVKIDFDLDELIDEALTV